LVNQDSTQFYYTDLTAIPDPQDHFEFNIAPNPASDLLLLEVPESFSGVVTIYSITGAKQMEYKAGFDNFYQLNIGSLLPGQYILSLRSPHRLVSKAFVKQ
jgi:hypothetical protein